MRCLSVQNEEGHDAVEEERDFSRGREQPDPTKILLTVSLKGLYLLGGALISVCWFVIRLWMGGIEKELQSIRTDLSAAEAARNQNASRITSLEYRQGMVAEQHINYDRAFEAVWKKFDRIEDDRWNNRKR